MLNQRVRVIPNTYNPGIIDTRTSNSTGTGTEPYTGTGGSQEIIQTGNESDPYRIGDRAHE